MLKFHEEVLGFRISDWLGEFIVFLRCNPAHHRLAIMPGKPALNDVVFDVSSVDAMMRGLGRLTKERVTLSWEPGRHTAGNNTFTYYLTLNGNAVEVSVSRRAPASAPRRLTEDGLTGYGPTMDFDLLLVRFFGTADIAALAPERIVAGMDRLRLQFGLERDSEQRFALWCLMYMLGAAPDLTVAFKDEADREAAREFVAIVDEEMAEDE